jgi:hypothetical protein
MPKLASNQIQRAYLGQKLKPGLDVWRLPQWLTTANRDHEPAAIRGEVGSKGNIFEMQIEFDETAFTRCELNGL